MTVTARRCLVFCFSLLLSCNPSPPDSTAEAQRPLLSDGEYVLRAVHSDKCVDVPRGAATDGLRLQQWHCNGSPAQRFLLRAVGGPAVSLTNVSSQRALDVAERSTADGAPVQQWGYGGGENQKFELLEAGGGAFAIRALHSGKLLAVANDGTQDGAPLVQETTAPADARFKVEKVKAPEWKLVWSDEFDGPDGSGVDPKKWNVEISGGGFGNSELQHYTDKRENLRQEKGSLLITAQSSGADAWTCWYGKCRFTSARLHTQGKFEFTHGRVEARAQVPRGNGLWPAFWMLGNDIGEVGWPKCGEIDIMENLGREPSRVYGTLHGPGYSGGGSVMTPYNHPQGWSYADDFHRFAVEWEEGVVRFYVDDVLYETRTPASLPGGTEWAFEHPFFLLLNLAVGGNWPGPPDNSLQLPAQLKIDYVRVFQR
jgi:beta-glucanase (GH16 family)